MKVTFYTVCLLSLLLCSMTELKAQNGTSNDPSIASATGNGSDNGYTEGDSKFKLTGYTFLEFESEGGTSTFEESGFNPIFLWRNSDRLFFEAELEVEVGSSGAGSWSSGLALEFATMYYKLNDYVTFYSGKFLSPIGAFQERYHPAWINKSASKPIGFGHKVNGLKRLQGGSEIGFGLSGVLPMGGAKFGYNFFLSNGGVLDETDGSIAWKNLADNNNNKALGGRISILPFSNSTFELGLSGYTATVGTDGTAYSNVGASLFALDLNYVKAVSGVGLFDIKGQYQSQNVDKANYANVQDVTLPDFDNVTSAYYFQLAYKLPNIENSGFFNKLEFVARYASLNSPDNAVWGSDQNRTTIGLNYWASWNSVLKLAYEMEDDISSGTTNNAVLATFAMGF